MLMRKLGSHRLRVAALCLGGNTFGWTTDQKASEAVLDAYLEAGGNFIDTADVYSRWVPGNKGGESETALGTWMKARGNRHAVVIATKVMGPMGPGPNDSGLSRQHIVEAVEASLRRLQTDYIDLYQAHWDDRDTPLEETLRAFDDLVRQGKVATSAPRTSGVAADARPVGERPARLRPLRVDPAEVQPRDPRRVRARAGAALPRAGGRRHPLLVARQRIPLRQVPSRRRAAGDGPRRGVQKTYMTDRGFAVLDAVEKVATAVGATPAQVALSWLAHRPGITAPIVSATTVAQLKDCSAGSSSSRTPRRARRSTVRAPGRRASASRPRSAGG